MPLAPQTCVTTDDLRCGVDALTERGETITSIEDWINDLPVADQAKAATWLYAWSLQPPARQLADALGMLAEVQVERRVKAR